MKEICNTHQRHDKCSTQFWLEGMKGEKHQEHMGMGGRTVLKQNIRKWGGLGWSGFMWLTIETGGGLS